MSCSTSEHSDHHGEHDLHVDDRAEAERRRVGEGRVVHLAEHPDEKGNDRSCGERRQGDGHAPGLRAVCHALRMLLPRLVHLSAVQ